jgi:hypothetical protein
LSIKKNSVLARVALLIATVGIVTPMAWDYYKTKSAIELQLLSSVSLIKMGQTIDNLSILYNSKKASNISKLNFVLLNNGRLPIRRQDILKNPQITFDPSNEIYEFRIERVFPPELEISSTLDSKNNRVEISFPLLNKSDRIEFSVLVSGVNPTFNASTRISGISNLEIVDKTKETGNKNVHIPWTVIVVGVITLVIMRLSFSGIWTVIVQREQLRLFEQKYITIQSCISVEDTKKFIEGIFKETLANSVKNNINRYIDAINLQKDLKLNNQQIDAVYVDICKLIRRDIGYSTLALIIIIILTITGCFHVGSFIIYHI